MLRLQLVLRSLVQNSPAQNMLAASNPRMAQKGMLESLARAFANGLHTSSCKVSGPSVQTVLEAEMLYLCACRPYFDNSNALPDPNLRVKLPVAGISNLHEVYKNNSSIAWLRAKRWKHARKVPLSLVFGKTLNPFPGAAPTSCLATAV